MSNFGEKWDSRFILMARTVSGWSKNRSNKVGAVLVDQDKIIRSTGYNGIPRGLDDTVEERNAAGSWVKHLYYEHAERNVLWNCVNVGIPTAGCSLYVTHLCCPDCTRGIIQCKIKEVVVDAGGLDLPFYLKYKDELAITIEMLAESSIELRYHDPEDDDPT